MASVVTFRPVIPWGAFRHTHIAPDKRMHELFDGFRHMSTAAAPDKRMHVLFDGSCPLCRKEINLLTKLKRSKEELHFIDIAEKGFTPAQYPTSPSLDQLMAEMHVFDPRHQRMYTKMEAFRQLYSALGLGWLWAWTAVWPFRPAADAAYLAFARNRHHLAKYMQ